AALAGVVVGAERDGDAALEHLPDGRRGAVAVEGAAGADGGGDAGVGERLDVVVVGLGEQVGGRAADLGGDLGGADALVGAGVHAGLQPGALAGEQEGAGLLGGEVPLVAVDVDGVGA